MDGRVLLVVFAGIAGLIGYISIEGLSLGSVDSGPSAPPKRAVKIIDERHDRIRAAMVADGRNVDDPASYVFERAGYRIVGGPVAATSDGGWTWVTDVFPWYGYPEYDVTPASVVPLLPMEGCSPRRPAVGASVAHVFSGPTPQAVPIYAYQNATLDHLAAERIQSVRTIGIPKAPSLLDKFSEGAPDVPVAVPVSPEFQFSAFEVVVTESRRPVHLVLQSGGGRLLWNLSLAPDVEISGITLLGGTISAVANAPEDVPIDALTDDVLADCGVTRARHPLQSDPIFVAVDQGALTQVAATELLEARMSHVIAWDARFAAWFGRSDTDTRIGADLGAIAAVVGPVPGQAGVAPVGYHGFEDRPIWMTAHDASIVAPPAKAEWRMKLRIDNRAEDLLGVPLESLVDELGAPVETN